MTITFTEDHQDINGDKLTEINIKMLNSPPELVEKMLSHIRGMRNAELIYWSDGRTREMDKRDGLPERRKDGKGLEDPNGCFVTFTVDGEEFTLPADFYTADQILETASRTPGHDVLIHIDDELPNGFREISTKFWLKNNMEFSARPPTGQAT